MVLPNTRRFSYEQRTWKSKICRWKNEVERGKQYYQFGQKKKPPLSCQQRQMGEDGSLRSVLTSDQCSPKHADLSAKILCPRTGTALREMLLRALQARCVLWRGQCELITMIEQKTDQRLTCGQRFGRWIVLGGSMTTPQGKRKYLCRCWTARAVAAGLVAAICKRGYESVSAIWSAWMKKENSLQSFCERQDRMYLLQEWDQEKNAPWPQTPYIRAVIWKSGGIVKMVIHGFRKSGFVQMVRCVLTVPGGCSGAKAMIYSPWILRWLLNGTMRKMVNWSRRMYWKEAINMLGESVRMDIHGELAYSAEVWGR